MIKHATPMPPQPFWNMESPINKKDLKVAVLFFKNKPKLVVYLGYNSIRDFQKLHSHSMSLYYYVTYHEHCKSQSAKITLFILYNKPNKLVFGLNVKKLLYKFLVTKITGITGKTINIQPTQLLMQNKKD